MAIISNFSVTRDQIITAALKECGAISANETPSTQDVADISFSFNLLIKAWIKGGMPLWKVVELQIPLLANQLQYQIGPSATGPGALVIDRPLRMLDVFLRNVSSSVDLPIQILSRQEYEQFGNKTQGSVTNAIYYQPLIPNGLLTVYPPVSASSLYTLHLFAQVPINDVIAASDIPDFPSECYQALKWNLASEIAGPYVSSENKIRRIDAFAMQYKREMENWSQEEASLYLGYRDR